MKKKFGTMGTALVVFLMVSCSSSKVTGADEGKSLAPVYVTNSKSIQLLAPECMDGAIDNVQLLNGSFGKQNFSLISYFQADSNGIFIALLNDFGTDMGSASYDGKSVVFESPVFPKNMKAEYIIADIQNAYYKSECLKDNYSKSGLSFEEEKTENCTKRYVKNGKNVIEEITISEKSIRIVNNLRGYEYNLIEGEE